MPFTNFDNRHFATTEKTAVNNAVTAIETALATKLANLTAEERQQYGSVNEQNKLFVNKAKEFMEQYPQHIPAFLNKDEFDKDYSARTQIEQRLNRMANLTEQLRDTKILLDHDNWFNALSFYRNIKFLSGENAPGTTTLYQDIVTS